MSDSLPRDTSKRARAWLLPVAVVAALAAGFGLGFWRGRAPRTLSPPRSLSSWHKEALASIPSEAAIVASFDVGFLVDTIIDTNAGLFAVKSDTKATREAMSEASKAVFGVDLLGAKRAVVWAVPEQAAVAVMLEGEFTGSLRGEPAKEGAPGAVVIDGETSALVTPAGLLLGTRSGVRLGAETIAGTHASITKDDAALKDHELTLNTVGEGQFIVTTRLGALSRDLPKMFAGVRGGGVALRGDGGITLCAIGPESTLSGLVAMVESAKTAGKASVVQLLARETTRATVAGPDADPDGAGWAVLGLTLLKFKYDDLVGVATFEQKGETATLNADGPGGFLAVYLGALSGVAISGFTRYLERAKTESYDVILSRLESEIQSYAVRKGALPESLDVLREDGALTAEQLRDAWGGQIQYKRGTSTRLDDFQLCSPGPDHVLGTDDDRCNRGAF